MLSVTLIFHKFLQWILKNLAGFYNLHVRVEEQQVIEMFQDLRCTQNILHVSQTFPSLPRCSGEVVIVELILFQSASLMNKH